LLALEQAWVNYVGNPSTVEDYDPEDMAAPLVDLDAEEGHGGLCYHPRTTVFDLHGIELLRKGRGNDETDSTWTIYYLIRFITIAKKKDFVDGHIVAGLHK